MTDALKELADAGALCPTCGGVCIDRIETAITALHTAEKTGTKLPWCSCNCPDCPICRDFRAGIQKFIATNPLIDATNHEDAL